MDPKQEFQNRYQQFVASKNTLKQTPPPMQRKSRGFSFPQIKLGHILILLLAISVPTTLVLLKQPQDLRQRASGPDTNSAEVPPGQTVFKIGDKLVTTADIEAQNTRLIARYEKQLNASKITLAKLTNDREKILKYAEDKKITVSEQELNTALSNSPNKGNLSDKEFKDIAWWSILKNKVSNSIENFRMGEYITVRWDAYSPKIDKDVANEKQGTALVYLNQIRDKIISREIKDIYQVYSNLDITSDPVFQGKQKEYGVQYIGWDDKKNSYHKFVISPSSQNTEDLGFGNLRSVKPPVCTLGGCHMYNILFGSNGDEANKDLLKILENELII